MKKLNEVYAIGLIYSPLGDKLATFTWPDSIWAESYWPMIVNMKRAEYLVQRFNSFTADFFEQKVEWENVKPVELMLPGLSCTALFQVFRTFDPGLIYTAHQIVKPADYANKHFRQLAIECSDPALLPFKSSII